MKKACIWTQYKKRCLYHVLIIHVHLSRSLFLRSRKLIPSACGSPCRICWMSSWTSRRVSLAPWLTSISSFLHKEGQKCYAATCTFFVRQGGGIIQFVPSWDWAVFRIQIHCFRIQPFRLNSDPDLEFRWQKLGKMYSWKKLYFLSKNFNLLIPRPP